MFRFCNESRSKSREKNLFVERVTVVDKKDKKRPSTVTEIIAMPGPGSYSLKEGVSSFLNMLIMLSSQRAKASKRGKRKTIGRSLKKRYP